MTIQKLALALLLGAAGTSALAEVNVSVGIGLPGLVYAPPAYLVPGVMYAPRPAMVAPQPVYAPRWRGDDDDDHDEWKKWRKHQRKEHRRWHHEREDHDD